MTSDENPLGSFSPEQIEAMAEVAAELMRETHRRMTALEGNGWNHGSELELFLLETGQLAVRAGGRTFTWAGREEPDRILETAFGHARVIDPDGRVVDQTLLEPPPLN